MKGVVYLVVLLFSLPKLLVGVVAVVIRHTFATFNPLQMVNDFFFQMFWGVPLAGGLFLLLLVLGLIARTRPYAALFAFILNATAVGFVLHRFGLPNVFDKAIYFLPLLLAQIGFAWLAFAVLYRTVE
jgi:hypothetical protein